MSVANILRLTRTARGVSQVTLASRLEVSARHVSFLETGRAQPSRELVMAWMRELAAPASVRNAALHEAGYSPHNQNAAPDPHMLTRIVDLHDPLPGLVFDADRRVQHINRSGRWLCSLIMPRYCARIANQLTGMDLIDAIADEHGLLSSMRNAAAASEELLRQLQLEALTRVELSARVAQCVESLRTRYGVRGGIERATGSNVATFLFDTPFGLLRFVTYQAAFGLPHDVTPTSLRCELWYGLDQHTREVMSQTDLT